MIFSFLFKNKKEIQIPNSTKYISSFARFITFPNINKILLSNPLLAAVQIPSSFGGNQSTFLMRLIDKQDENKKEDERLDYVLRSISLQGYEDATMSFLRENHLLSLAKYSQSFLFLDLIQKKSQEYSGSINPDEVLTNACLNFEFYQSRGTIYLLQNDIHNALRDLKYALSVYKDFKLSTLDDQLHTHRLLNLIAICEMKKFDNINKEGKEKLAALQSDAVHKHLDSLLDKSQQISQETEDEIMRRKNPLYAAKMMAFEEEEKEKEKEKPKPKNRIFALKIKFSGVSLSNKIALSKSFKARSYSSTANKAFARFFKAIKSFGFCFKTIS